MEEYRSNTQENRTETPGGSYQPAMPQKKKSENRAAGYILVGLLCLLIGLAMGSCSTALVISGARKAVQAVTPDKDGAINFDEIFGDIKDGDFNFEWHFGDEEPFADDKKEEKTKPGSNEYREPEKKEYVTRELPEFDGTAPVITDAASPVPEIVDQVRNGVVMLTVYDKINGRDTAAGMGSGFVISTEGYIMTNAHVIRDSSKVVVTFADKSEADARIIGYDVKTDVAIIKIEKEGITALKLGDSDKVKVGEFSIAMGNPSGEELAGTSTFGIISATGRSVNLNGQTNYYIQTDAAINFGSSGGALFNMKGEVIGIPSAKNVYSGVDSYGNPLGAEGLGFAIPINTAMDVARMLITEGRVVRPGIGISVLYIDPETAEAADVAEGMLVCTVTRNGSGHKSGLKVDDIIIGYDGNEVKDGDGFLDYVKNGTVGDNISLAVIRGNKEVTVEVTLIDTNELGTEMLGETDYDIFD